VDEVAGDFREDDGCPTPEDEMKLSEMFSHWEQVRADLMITIDKFGEDELTFTPFGGSWPVGKIMLHIADTEDYWLHTLVRKELPDTDYHLADYPTKDAIKGVLDRARGRTASWLDSLTERDLDAQYTTRRGNTYSLRWIIWHVLEHEIHHRGELSMALGLLGREGLDV
jgi:uncharacterized damage-inducible protein DinB